MRDVKGEGFIALIGEDPEIVPDGEFHKLPGCVLADDGAQGLDGEFSMRTRVCGVMRASMSSMSGWKSLCGYRGYGTGTAFSSRLVMAKVG